MFALEANIPSTYMSPESLQAPRHTFSSMHPTLRCGPQEKALQLFGISYPSRKYQNPISNPKIVQNPDTFPAINLPKKKFNKQQNNVLFFPVIYNCIGRVVQKDDVRTSFWGMAHFIRCLQYHYTLTFLCNY